MFIFGGIDCSVTIYEAVMPTKTLASISYRE